MRFFQKMFNNISTKEKWLLLSLIFLGTYLRFYNLDWGVPFLHPDEFNIGLGVSRLQFPDNLNPDFFAYGSFPIYITYLLGIIWYSISEGQFINQLTA